MPIEVEIFEAVVKIRVLIRKLLQEIISSFFYFFFINVERQQVNIDRGWNRFANNVSSFEFSNPGVP